MPGGPRNGGEPSSLRRDAVKFSRHSSSERSRFVLEEGNFFGKHSCFKDLLGCMYEYARARSIEAKKDQRELKTQLKSPANRDRADERESCSLT